ncbi:MAG: DUF5130 family protein [Mycobacteriales bacterium]
MPAGNAQLRAPFSSSQLVRISDALHTADAETQLTFSVYVGDLDSPTDAHARRLHAQLEKPADSVLLALAPNQRMLEIVTGEHTRARLTDQSCGLVALSMASTLAGGDLTGAVVTGVRMLADRARW